MKIVLAKILLLITHVSFAQNFVVSEISEDCLYDAQEKFSQLSGVKVNKFKGLVTDAGGYGIYKSLRITYLSPAVGELTYNGATLSVSPNRNDLTGLVELIQSLCQKTTNKTQKKDADKNSAS